MSYIKSVAKFHWISYRMLHVAMMAFLSQYSYIATENVIRF